jgi:preprotein translocase subunit YajC
VTNTLALLLAVPSKASGGSGITVFAVQIAAFIAIFYFLLIRPQRQMQKKHQAMLAAVKKGDEVMTEGGIIGQVVFLGDDRLTIRTAENTRVVVARGKIARVLTTEGAAPAPGGK